MTQAISQSNHAPPSYRPLLILAGIFALFFAANPQIIADWRIYSFDDGTYSHAYLIPFMSAYIAWSGWKAGALTPRGSWRFLALTLALLLLYQWLDIAHQRYASRALIPAVLVSATLTMFPVNRTTLSVGSFFWFVTPVWGPINEFLQYSSVRGVNYIMSFTGIPTFVYDEFVEIPAGTFEIANGCSGLRYVIAALALVTFYSVMYLKHPRSMLTLVTLAVIGSMLTNWLRIVALILIGHFSDMQAGIINDHNMFGWFLFIPLMFLIFFFADRLERNDSAAKSGPAVSSSIKVPSPLILIALVLTLALTSGAVLRTVMNVPAYVFDEELDVETSTAMPLPLKPAPRIYAASEFSVGSDAVSGDELPEGSIHYHFRFNGNTDSQRAEFYLNQLVPDGWNVVRESLQGNQRIIIVKRRNLVAQVGYQYRIGTTTTGVREELRWARLLAALKLDRSSELVWSFRYCNASCAGEAYEVVR